MGNFDTGIWEGRQQIISPGGRENLSAETL